VRNSVVGAAVLAASLAFSAGSAQPAPPPAPAAAPAAFDAKVAVAEIRRVLAANYVLPDMRAKLDAAFAKGLAEGRYDVADPRIFAERVNTDLAATAHDKHLNFRYAPEQAARFAARPRQDDDAPPSADDIAEARRHNHGIVELKLLPGNVRYMDMDGFVWAGPTSAAAFDDAMRFLAAGDAVIIDLRHNGGGSPEAVQYLVSHFLPAGTPLVTFHMGADKVNSLAALKTLPAGRLIGKPLYVLTSGRTASAAEEFTGHIAGYKLGETIGETTAGAGFRNTFFPIPGGFVMSVSVGRAVLASTGKDWEGVGIPASTAVPVDKALDVARMHAMRRLAQTGPAGEKAAYEGMAAVLAAKVDPVTPALPLGAYAGRYGDRIVAADAAGLSWQRQNGPKVRMIPLGPNLFAFEEDPLTRIEFKVAGDAVSGLDMIRGDGSRLAQARTN